MVLGSLLLVQFLIYQLSTNFNLQGVFYDVFFSLVKFENNGQRNADSLYNHHAHSTVNPWYMYNHLRFTSVHCVLQDIMGPAGASPGPPVLSPQGVLWGPGGAYNPRLSIASNTSSNASTPPGSNRHSQLLEEEDYEDITHC